MAHPPNVVSLLLLRVTSAWRTSENSVWAKFGAWLRLRQFKVARAVLVQQDAEREAIQGFAVLHRRKRIRAVLQTRPQGSLRARQFQQLGSIFGQQGTEPFSRVSWERERSKIQSSTARET